MDLFSFFYTFDGAVDEFEGGLSGGVFGVAGAVGAGGDADGGGFGVGEHHFDAGGQCGAGGAGGGGEVGAADFFGGEDVHVNMDENEVGDTAEALHLLVDVGCQGYDIVG